MLCRHEQAAAFAADAYGRLTGKAGVCLGTLGPGATNLVTGVADANMDCAPLVCIIGQGSTRRLHKENHQNMDSVQFTPDYHIGLSNHLARSLILSPQKRQTYLVSSPAGGEILR